jgi:DNA-binding MarR family transcriptional regulator
MRRGEALYDVLRLTRPLVLGSARVVEATWRPDRVTVAMRAVLEVLLARGPHTVPQLARELDLARQGVQRTIGDLERSGYVAAARNPAHKRSPLYAPTDAARDLFAARHRDEVTALDAMAGDLTVEEIETAQRVLATLLAGVRQRAHELTEDDDER